MSLDTDDRIKSLDHERAVRLDERIQDLAGKTGEHLGYLTDLLAEAKSRQIHQVLKFDSWIAYLVERLKPITKALDADKCRALMVELSEAGMSLRAIAEATNTSKSTVARQVSQTGTGEDETTGRDGKTYQRRNHGGGHRGPLTPDMTLNRAKAAIGNITGLEADAANVQAEICKLIEELLASIQLATKSN